MATWMEFSSEAPGAQQWTYGEQELWYWNGILFFDWEGFFIRIAWIVWIR